jgi:hypothetical protein
VQRRLALDSMTEQVFTTLVRNSGTGVEPPV